MSFQRHKTNSLNRYSPLSQRNCWNSLTKRIVSVSLISIVIISITSLVLPDKVVGGDASSIRSLESQKSRCWMKRALKSGDFVIFSHRSYHDNTQSNQPSCEESLSRLKKIGVNHMDLDLVMDEHATDAVAKPRLLVAHPMEFKRMSDYYSPCANTEFDEMIDIVKRVYGTDEFFLSMEPKAAWQKTQQELDDVALTNLPSNILEQLLDAIQRHDLKGKCAAIVEINEAHDDNELEKERRLLNKILQHCQLFRGIRLSDEPPSSMGEYDILMPSIEFHPSHLHNTGGKVIPEELRKKSILWVVDNESDLQFAADLRPFGIVSNSPKNIVGIIDSSSWCKV